jgi:hypothetical protein
MPCRSISLDLCESIPVLFYEQGHSVCAISTILGVKKTFIYDNLKYHHLYGVPYNAAAPPKCLTGRYQCLSKADQEYIRALIGQCSTIYLDEICDELAWNRGKFVSIQTILYTLQQLHFTQKGLSARAFEQNEIQQMLFWQTVAELITHPDQVMFTDETLQDCQTSGRTRGWSLGGQRCIARKFFIRGQQYSILPIMTMDGSLHTRQGRQLHCPMMVNIQFRY